MQGFKDLGSTLIYHDGPLSWFAVTSDPELSEIIYSSNVHITKASQYDFLKRWLGQGLLTSDGKTSS